MTYTLRVYMPGEIMAPEIWDETIKLFDRNYYYYHYKKNLLSSETIRILAVENDRIIGYAGIMEYVHFFKFQNLLVCKEHRGKSIGKVLENKRYKIVKEKLFNKGIYVSCVANDMISQSLKISIGLVPINVKYGFRKNVFYQGDRGSAVTFASEAFFHPKAIGADAIPSRILEDHSMSRIRIFSSCTDEINYYVNGHLEGDYYVEILTNNCTVGNCFENHNLFSSGFDYDLENGKLFHSFQIKNINFTAALNANPQICEPLVAKLKIY